MKKNGEISYKKQALLFGGVFLLVVLITSALLIYGKSKGYL
jgi:hypothetical protein